MGVTWDFRWDPDAWVARVPAEVEGRLLAAGRAWYLVALRVVPVDTGQLRAGLDHRVIGGLTLIVSADAPYASYVEWGTRHSRPYPYLRPGLPEIFRVLGGTFAIGSATAPAGAPPLARAAGFARARGGGVAEHAAIIGRHLAAEGRRRHRGRGRRPRIVVRSPSP